VRSTTARNEARVGVAPWLEGATARDDGAGLVT
jgi:hypothetical protein